MSEELTGTGSEEPVTSALTGEPAVEAVTETSAEFNFRDHLSDEYKSDDSLKDFKDLDGLVKSYKSAQSMIGSSVRIPGEDATAEQRAEFLDKIKDVEGVGTLPDRTNEAEMRAFFQKMGCPEEASGYKLEIPEGGSLEGLEGYIEAAHAAGLNSDQLQALANVNIQHAQAAEQARSEQHQNCLQQLEDTFGENKDQVVKEAELGLRRYSEKYPDAVKDLLNGSGKNNLAVIAMLSDLSKMGQESTHKGTEAAQSNGMSIKDVNQKIADMLSNREFMQSLGDPTHINYEINKRTHRELYELRSSLRQ